MAASAGFASLAEVCRAAHVSRQDVMQALRGEAVRGVQEGLSYGQRSCLATACGVSLDLIDRVFASAVAERAASPSPIEDPIESDDR